MAVATVLLSGRLVQPVREAPVKPRPTPGAVPGRPLFGGSLEPGVRYMTQGMRPALSFVVPQPFWFVPDAGATGGFVIQRRENVGAPGGETPPRTSLGFWHPQSVYDPARRGSRSGAEVPPPDDLVAWLHDHPDFDAGPVSHTQLAGRPATVFGARAHARGIHHGSSACARAGRRCVALAPDAYAFAGDLLRVYVVTSAAGPLVVTLEAPDTALLARVSREAAPVLRSLRLGS